MPYDTVIDKAQLESAITASANAIREKTGDTALIEWLSDKGFAEAIAAIQTGGGEDIDLGDVTFCKVIYLTPATNITGKIDLPQNNKNQRVLAISTSNRNGISFESGGIRSAIATQGGWAIRLVMTSSAQSGRKPEIGTDDVSFDTSIYLQAGITYRLVWYGQGD